MKVSGIFDELVGIGLNAHSNVPLGPLTTYGVGGLGACVVKLQCREDAFAIANVLSQYPNVPIVVMGRGSNLLVSDTGFDGVIVQMAISPEENQVEVVDGVVHANGAMLMPVLARRSVNAGRGGLEWCVGIPGTVGGAVRMNAGGHGADMTSSVVDATVLSLRSGQAQSVTAEQLGFYFRGSALSSHHIVLSVRLRTVAQESSGNVSMSPQPNEMQMSPGLIRCATADTMSERNGAHTTSASLCALTIAFDTISPVTPSIFCVPDAYTSVITTRSAPRKQSAYESAIDAMR